MALLALTTTLAVTLATATPSASTLAAVKIFAVNVDRQWPADDGRGQAVTAEALHLMTVAAKAMADDWKIDDRKLRSAIADLDASREALSQHPRGDRQRPELARDALEDGRKVLDHLAVALGCADLTEKDRTTLEKLAKEFEKNRPVRQQVDDLARYFKEASKLLQSMIDAAPAPRAS